MSSIVQARHQVDAAMRAKVAHAPAHQEDADYDGCMAAAAAETPPGLTASTGAKLWAAHGLGTAGWLCLASGKWRACCAGKRAAAIMSLLHSARINGHEPYA
jgi:hypothetical protein